MKKQKMNSKGTFIYKIQTSDTVSELSKKFGIPEKNIIDANAGLDFNDLKTGQSMNIPQPDPYFSWADNFPQVRQGDRGHAVAAAQTVLNRLQYTINVDGIFGPITKNAVMIYQGYANLAKDGIVGPLTWGNMQNRWLTFDYISDPFIYYTINNVPGNTFRYHMNACDHDSRWQVWYNPGSGIGWYYVPQKY